MDSKRLSKHKTLNFKDNGLDHIRSLLFTKKIVLLMTIDKFDLNPILVNINKLKPYGFAKDHIFQLVLTKLSGFLSKEPMEATHFDSLFIKQPIEVT
jgi:hypothetical protein